MTFPWALELTPHSGEPPLPAQGVAAAEPASGLLALLQ